MKKPLCFSLALSLMILGCAKKEETVRLEQGTATYELAKEISNSLPYLDPDENNILVSTNKFNVTTGECIQAIYFNYGNRANQLKSLDGDELKGIIKQHARDLAEKKLIIKAAQEANLIVTQAALDSLMNLQYEGSGGIEKYNELLQTNGISIDLVQQNIRNDMMIQNYHEKIYPGEIQVSEEDIQKAYAQDKTASVRHILMNTQGKSDIEKLDIRKKMKDLLERARQGEDFAELAGEYTEDPGSKDSGGLYEDFGRGRMVKPFDEAAFSVPVGEISDIVQTEYGFHILKVIERKKETRPLEEVRTELETQLKEQEQVERYQAIVDDLKQDAAFEVVDF